jgi:prepilin-type N-terminal cleavage/methylation domain-containing protein
MKNGFTLIELMIVVAIIGILAAIAIPAYQDYVIRSQVSEGLAMASAAKVSVAEYYANKGGWPLDNSAAGLGAASTIQGKYVSSIGVDTGGITSINIIILQNVGGNETYLFDVVGKNTPCVDHTGIKSIDRESLYFWLCFFTKERIKY